MLGRTLLRWWCCWTVAVLLTVTSPSNAEPGKMNNELLWKRLGVNRAIDGGVQPRITSTKKKGESTVYFIKLPPQPHYYIPLNHIGDGVAESRTKTSTPDPFETVSVAFTANGKPESVYHWNLPLGFTMPGTSTTSKTTTTTTTTPAPPSSTPAYGKKPFRQNFYYNGKPQKLYFVKPGNSAHSWRNKFSSPEKYQKQKQELRTTTVAPTSTPPSNKAFKKSYHSNGKPKSVYFVKRSHHRYLRKN